MQSIETLVIETYQNNITYFTEHQPKLLKMLNVLDQAMENGDFSPRYDLEYLEGYFDVKELSSGHYLYNGNSNDISKEFSNIVNFSKNKYTFEGLPVYKSANLNSADINKIEMEGILPLMDYYLDNTHEDDIMSTIEKFIVVGVALGFHLPIIDEIVQASEYLIIEDDLELFRLSLFTTDYAKLGQNAKLYFSIADDDHLFLITMLPFLDDSFYNNRFLKYAHFPTHSTNKLKQIQNAILSQGFISFPYRVELNKTLKPLEYLNNNNNLLNISKKIPNDLFSTHPVLLITAGPSLQKNIEWLKENHTKFIVVAVSATVRILQKHNIVPSIITHIDGFTTSLRHYEDANVKRFLKDTMIVLGPFANPVLTKLFPKEHIFYYEEDTEYIEGSGFLSAPCVGSFSLLFCLAMGSKELYLLGLDLALNQKTGATHSNEHVYNNEKDMSQKDNISNQMSLRNNLFPIKGNFESVVYTNTLFNLSIQFIQNNIQRLKDSSQNIYNFNDGAYIAQSMPTKIDDIDITHFRKLQAEELKGKLEKVLKAQSITKLSVDDRDSLKGRLEYSNEINRKIATYVNSVSKTNVEAFLSDFLGLVSDILKTRKRETNNIVQVYYSYFRNVLPIVFDFFNTQGMKNKKQHIKNFNLLIVKEMQNIEKIYSKALENFLSGKNQVDITNVENFMVTIYDIDKDKLRDVYTKDSIGFLAVDENLLDVNFVNYIKELYVKFPQVNFEVFYFNNAQNRLVENIFSNELDRFKFIIPKNIYEIVKAIEIYLYNGKIELDRIIYLNILKHSMEVVGLDSTMIRQSVKEIDAVNATHIIFKEYERFEISKDQFEIYGDTCTRLIYQRLADALTSENHEIDINSRTFYTIDRIDWILNMKGFKDKFIKSFLNKILYGK
jgi:hypothetical protein